MNKKTLLILLVVFFAICSVTAVGMFYVLNKGRRQRVLLESADKYVAEKEYSRAVLQYKRAVSLGNATGGMYFKYGVCLENLDQRNAALQAFERAATLDEKNVEARKRVVEAYYEASLRALKQPDADPGKVKALQKLEIRAGELMRLRPGERVGYVWLARAQQLKGEQDEALGTIERGLAQLADDGELILARRCGYC